MPVCYLCLWYFFLYAFLGWCSEVCYAALKTGDFVNRGFLNGPLCPIYGFGAVTVIFLLTPLRDNLPLLFLGSVLLTSALEWLTGFVLEKLFHQKWWDYSDMPFQLNGYICLMFSILWGFACLIVVDMIHPAMQALVGRIPFAAGVVLLVLLMLAALADLGATVAAMVGFNRRLGQIDELARRIKSASNELGEGLSSATLTLTEKGSGLREELSEKRAELKAVQENALAELKAAHEALLSHHGFGQRRLLKAFPRMTSTRHAAAVEALRGRMNRTRNKKR
ncbi:hypothetical protein D1159_00845 [Pseudoflavonifractor sp. 524-17]|uniref:putative ABC transporter permease n=1 Tax=Pseudoflavonifractor sp. 524-17 TaxID=2304577 RepID=UPI00137A7364|nr:putative ABC transporter permease [Pseudoflavonifractor sp. 524-17]NCE63160.1 hypothetical protein [Pseudoflavonifractor sp. 524-17]